MRNTRKLIVVCVALAVLLAAAVPFLSGCKQQSAQPDGTSVSFTLKVTGKDGKTTPYALTSAAPDLGQALLDEGLISGEQGEFGLYIKTVCGETHIFEDDGMYWAFYIDGEYASAGVDSTPITAGAVYELRAE